MTSRSLLRTSLPSLQHQDICRQCLLKLTKNKLGSTRPFATNPSRQAASSRSHQSSASLGREYFWANRRVSDVQQLSESFAVGDAARNEKSLEARSISVGNDAGQREMKESRLQDTQDISYSRKRRRKGAVTETDDTASEAIPPDASSRLVTASATAPPSSLRRQFSLFLSLSKPRLTFLVVLTAATPYGLYPIPDLLSSAGTASPSLSAATLLFLTTGTFLASASANTFNMLLEPKYDARMSRTRNRPLVRKLVTPRAAAIFGTLAGAAGVAILYFGCNPTTSVLGAGNILLYAGVYTPLKRISTVNTWVGALVGALPPLMGWTAAAGQYSSHGDWRELLFSSQEAVGGWLLAALLFAWQFPHFNALSHTIREEYAAAGYKMLCSVNPARNARVALRYSLLMFPISFGLLAVGVVGGPTVTSPTSVLWLVGSGAANGWMTMAAVRFWRQQGGKGTARGLFWASVWQLPILLVMAMALKKGMWSGLAERLGLKPGLDEDEDDELFGVGEEDGIGGERVYAQTSQVKA